MGCFGFKAKRTRRSTTVPTVARTIASNVNSIPITHKYIIGDQLGTGGFSIVKEATSKDDGEKYAVKIIDKSIIKEDIKLLKREIGIMQQADHKNILKLHEIYEDETSIYIVMELVNGSELFDRIIEKGYYSERNAMNVVRQILDAVAYLHSKGIAHRDLKPENLLCSGTDENEIVKIADFGLSKIKSDEDLLSTSCGTPGYVAPEVLLCKTYNESVDMWGIGIITFILLAGFPPFYNENNPLDDAALFEKVINVDYDLDDDCWDDVSDLAKDFIQHLLLKDPNDRLTAEEAKKHAWFQSEPKDKDLRISRRMSEYNSKRKENLLARRDESLVHVTH
eukprot:TRINITY_DN466_c0_g1_i4.p1 TRINITY_DN466_c0_g1~~TRINITY_DN466_c0_g1_i4.p1  ORF type:complete len:337 (+),score=57.97 TRINITY_DN466_c0_g1_i4:110-1120(+)